MFAFYLLRGHSKRELENLTYREKLFYYEVMALEIEHEQKKMESLLGGSK